MYQYYGSISLYIHHRLALNTKSLPYRTHWVPFAGIRQHCISIHAKPTIRILNPSDGSLQKEIYTLPVIYDPKTGRTVEESFEIAKYLDEVYPEGGEGAEATFVPKGQENLQPEFTALFTREVIQHLLPLVIAYVGNGIPGKAEYAFWKRTREERLGGKTVDEFAVSKDDVQRVGEVWGKAIQGFEVIGKWVDEHRETSEGWMLGGRITWADILLGSWVLSLKRMWGEDDWRWKELMRLDDGRWRRFVERMDMYDYVDEDGRAMLEETIKRIEAADGIIP